MGRLDSLTVSRGFRSSSLCLTMYPSIYIPVFCVWRDRACRVIWVTPLEPLVRLASDVLCDGGHMYLWWKFMGTHSPMIIPV